MPLNAQKLTHGGLRDTVCLRTETFAKKANVEIANPKFFPALVFRLTKGLSDPFSTET
jgi:hypothetical protein